MPILAIRLRTAGVIALAVATLTACGKATPTPTKQSAAARLMAVCSEASRELLNIDKQKLRPSKLSVVGVLIATVAHEGEQIDQLTAAKIRHLQPSAYTTTTLADLAHSRAELQTLSATVNRHGVAYRQLPRATMVSLLRANSGCDRVQLRKPISG
jgi:predicted nucleic acid-binding Zn ribbon protein